MQPQHSAFSYVIPGLIAAVFVGLRIWRSGGLSYGKNSPGRRLRLEFLWIVPAIFVVAALVMLVLLPPPALWQWGVLGLVLAVGAGLGWWRGTLMRIEVDRETHKLNMKASPAALILLGGVILVRYAARFLIAEDAEAIHLYTALISDSFVLLAAGFYGVSRVEMFLRARRLLREAKAEQVFGTLVDPGGEAPRA